MSALDKLKQLAQVQKKRYELKGINHTATAVFLLFAFFWTSTQLGRILWPQHIGSTANFVFFGSFIIHTLTQLICFMAYLPGYLGLNDYYNQHLINKKASRLWQRGNWVQVRNKMIKNFMIKQFLIYPGMVWVSTRTSIALRFTQFPSLAQVFTQILIIYVVQDILFFLGHYALHTNQTLYKFHKVHHQLDVLFTFASEYHDPWDYAIPNMLPSAIALALLGTRVHCFTFFLWIVYKIIISAQNHSGYDFPWSPFRVMPLVGGADFHDHHHNKNVGAYGGTLYVWDLLLSTSDDYFKQFLTRKAQ